MNSSTIWTDWMGIVASIACAIHCAAMPLVVGFLPVMGLSFLADESFHKAMVVVCSVIAAAAFIPGLRRHRRLLPIGVAAVGLSLISTAAFALEGQCCDACPLPAAAAETSAEEPVCTDACCEENAEEDSTASADSTASLAAPSLGALTPWITPLGGLLLVSAHLTNRRFSCSNECCSSTPDSEPSV